MEPENCQNQKTSRGELCVLPLNAKLYAESTSGELAECVRDDPERDEYPDKEDANAEK